MLKSGWPAGGLELTREPAAALCAIIVSAIIDRIDGLIGVIHDTMRVRAMGEAEIVADLVEEDSTETMPESGRIGCR